MKYFFGCSLLILCGFQGMGEDLYLRAGASGSKTGLDWNNAWTDWNQVQWGTGTGKLGAGDTLWIAGGTYSGFSPAGNGTSTSQIYLKRVLASDPVPTSAPGWNSSFDSQVVSSGITFGTAHVGEWITFDGRIENGWKITVPNGGSAGVNWPSASVDNLTFRYLEVAGPAGATAFTYASDLRGFDLTAWNGSAWQPINNVTISHCNVHGCVDILYFANVHNSTVEYCKLYDCWAANSQVYHENVLLTLVSTDITFRYNIISNWATEGIEMGYGHSNWYIYGNVWVAGAAGPYKRALETQYQGSDHIYVYNNTFVGLWLCIYNDNSGGGWTSCELKNNIFLNSPVGNVGSGFTQANNLTDPATSIFQNYANKDFRLTASASVAIDKGVALTTDGFINKDMDGNLRGSGAGWDIGAYEYGTGSSDTTPPTVILLALNPILTDTVVLAATALDNVGGSGIASVTFRVDGNAVGSASASPFSLSWNTRTVANGSHTITAVARDLAGNQTTSSAIVVTVQNSVDTTAPTVNLSAPLANAIISNSITLSATASDNSGGSGVASVGFLVDGVSVGSDTTQPYSLTWDSRTTANGTHVILARAQDVAGNVGNSSSVTVTVQNSAPTLADGLVGHWPFDDGAGSTATDASGNGNNGALQNGATWALGEVGGCIAIDGQTGYVRVPSTSSLENVTDSVTVSAWVRIDGVTTVDPMQSIVRKVVSETLNDPPYASYDLVVQDFGGTFKPRIGVTRTDSTRTSVWGNSHNYGSWCLLTGVYDGANLRIYFNGVQEASTAFTGTLLQTGQPLCIGRYGSVTEPVQGMIDDLRIYNRALTAAEVLSLYNSTKLPPPTNLRIAQ